MLIQADARRIPLRDGCVQCCVSSPPYFGLRDYGVSGQIGLEPTPDEFVAALVGVYREVWRVLADDGVVWLNLGDNYAGGKTGRDDGDRDVRLRGARDAYTHEALYRNKQRDVPDGLKPKDLIGIPWRVAFALQADGWTLRSDVIWAKGNPMPESVTDRPTKSHEYLFMFSKARWVGPPRERFSGISDEDARWLALFLDTEGNIAVKRVERDGRHWYGAQIAIAGTNRDLVATAQRIIGAGTVLDRPGRNAPMFYLQLSNRQAAALLHRVYPFLIVKQRQARIVMHLQSLLRHRGGRGPDRRRSDAEVAVLESLWLRNKACNHFATPDLSDVPEPMYGRWDSQPYYYDAEAVSEPVGTGTAERYRYSFGERGKNATDEYSVPFRGDKPVPTRRNARTVWTINPKPYAGAHFATMPEKLAERCILAGSRPGDLVFDPFGGSGTTVRVARKFNRRGVMLDLNPNYLKLAADRISGVQPDIFEVPA